MFLGIFTPAIATALTLAALAEEPLWVYSPIPWAFSNLAKYLIDLNPKFELT